MLSNKPTDSGLDLSGGVYAINPNPNNIKIMELEGKLILDLGEQAGTSKAGNPWKKHEYVLETPGQYPRKVKFTVFGNDRCDSLCPRLVMGNNVRIAFDLESREYNGRWYTDVTIYNVMEAGAPGYPQPSAPQQPAAPADPFGSAPSAPNFEATDSTDDLPF